MSFKKHYISVPVIFDLTNEKSWEKLNKRNTKFFIMRFHFMVKVRDVESKVRDGGVLTVVGSPGMIGQERVLSIEIEKEYINFEETLATNVLDIELIQELEADLQVEVSASNFFKARNGLKEKISEKVKTSVTETFKSGNTVKLSKKISYQTKTTFNEQLTEKVYQIKQYQKCSFDVYLAYIDYLFVEYKKSFLGLRQKRRKLPRINNHHAQKRKNVIKLNQPLASIHFWKLIEDSSVYVKDSNYQNEVPNPDEMIVLPPEDRKQYHVEIPKDILSLYKISSKAFPVKWVERICGTSKEDLMKIEEEDYIVRWGKPHP